MPMRSTRFSCQENLRAQISSERAKRRTLRAAAMIEPLENRVLLSAAGTGSISGTFYYDSNANGKMDQGEPASPYWLVYLDSNNNGVHDANETEVRADANGKFAFTGLADGTYDVRPETAAGWTQTSPNSPGNYFLPINADFTGW